MLLILQLAAQDERVRGPRIGYDIGGLANIFLEPERSIHSFCIDYEIVQDLYPVVEFGWQDVHINKGMYDYSLHGMFIRAGADRNLFKYSNPADYDMGFAGIRYGFASMDHSASGIHIAEAYWGDLDNAEVPERRIGTHWLSVGGGLRVEAFRNFFMGWSVFGNIRLSQTEDHNMDPYNVPGFGEGSKKATLTISYTLSYRIPLLKF